MPQVRISGDLVSIFSSPSVFCAPQNECTRDDIASDMGTRSVVASE